VTRVGAIDLGTNATRLLVADVEDGRVDEVRRRTRITRLGEGVDARRRLLPVPIARVRNVLCDYRRELEDLGAERTLAVATSAVRDAENGEAFLGEVEWSYGFSTRLLSGAEEAAMTLRGVGPLEPGTVVVDIGGGSTELITEVFAASIDIGCVRLTERHGSDLDAMAAEIRPALPRLTARRPSSPRSAAADRRSRSRRSPSRSAGSRRRPTTSGGRASSSRTGAGCWRPAS
jgi:exopolyphosphatase/guanosine-5'-triphosphate,3'-diphosphate pyrophosphatase